MLKYVHYLMIIGKLAAKKKKKRHPKKIINVRA